MASGEQQLRDSEFTGRESRSCPITKYLNRCHDWKESPLLSKVLCKPCRSPRDMLGIIRHGASVVALMINFADTSVIADARTWMNIPEQLIVYASSVHSKLLAESRICTTRITMPGSALVVLTSRFGLVNSCLYI